MIRLDDEIRTAQFEVAAPDVVAEDFGGEVVVLNLGNGKYFSLSGIAGDIWRDLVDGCPPAALIALANATAAVPVAAAVETLATGLLAEGLLRRRGTPVGATPTTRFAGVSDVPAMESYDDMADLILADPIHDVEEDRGWPRKRDDG